MTQHVIRLDINAPSSDDPPQPRPSALPPSVHTIRTTVVPPGFGQLSPERRAAFAAARARRTTAVRAAAPADPPAKSKVCVMCGAAPKPDAKFCSACGTSLDKDAPAPDDAPDDDQGDDDKPAPPANGRHAILAAMAVPRTRQRFDLAETARRLGYSATDFAASHRALFGGKGAA